MKIKLFIISYIFVSFLLFPPRAVFGAPLPTPTPNPQQDRCAVFGKSSDSYKKCNCCMDELALLANKNMCNGLGIYASGYYTSLGCIPSEPPVLTGWIIEKGAGITGGIAFLLLLYGAFEIVKSGGVPEKIQKGKEIITSAIIGLVFIFLSVLLLRLIGVQILGIPGWI